MEVFQFTAHFVFHHQQQCSVRLSLTKGCRIGGPGYCGGPGIGNCFKLTSGCPFFSCWICSSKVACRETRKEENMRKKQRKKVWVKDEYNQIKEIHKYTSTCQLVVYQYRNCNLLFVGLNSQKLKLISTGNHMPLLKDPFVWGNCRATTCLKQKAIVKDFTGL